MSPFYKAMFLESTDQACHAGRLEKQPSAKAFIEQIGGEKRDI
jgi:hypothetical protein